MYKRHTYFPLWFVSCLCLLLLAGCDASSPPWELVWVSSHDLLQNTSPQTAYTTGAHARKPDGSQTTPAANIWLATGTTPKFGLALSQLDPTGQFFAISALSIDAGSNRWTITESASLTRPAPGDGVPAAQEYSKGWTLPAGTYESIAISIADTPPGGSAQLWISDTNQQLVLAHLYTTLQPPAGATPITLNHLPGWFTTEGSFTLIALPLGLATDQSNADLGMLLFAGTTNLAQSQRLIVQATAHLNDLLPS